LSNNYGFNLWQVGLTSLGIAVGMVIAICADLLYAPVQTEKR
jgi:hypothetical protein